VPPALPQVFTGDMIGPILKGRRAELYWPDDNMWYLIEISNVNMGDRTAGGCRGRAAGCGRRRLRRLVCLAAARPARKGEGGWHGDSCKPARPAGG
jgi:hypothetical protein